MIKNKILFIEGGFFSSQLLWTLIIFLEYARSKKIKEIIFEKKDEKILENKIIKRELKDFKINFLENLLPFHLKNNFILYLTLLPKSIFYSLFFKKKKINKKKWLKYQFYHSVIDTAQSATRDGDINPKYLTLLKSIYLAYKKIKLAKFLLKKKISTVVSSHNVYSVKAFNSIFRENNIPIYCQAVCNFYKQPRYRDENWNVIHNKRLRKKILSKINLSESEAYWKKKIAGKGDYYDSNLAYRKKNFHQNIKNIVMMHVFRDSPHIVLDKDRIFFDYIDWIDETIKILSKSKEKWYFKIHPNANQWGENSEILLKKLIKKNDAKNIIIINDGNLKLMKNLRKVVTYSGTATYEAISLGIKPIIISKISMYEHDRNSLLRPANLSDYKKLLLFGNTKKYKTNKKQQSIAKKFIYFNEKIMTLRKDINSVPIYRAEQNKKKKDYFMVNRNLSKNLIFLKKLGILISKGLTHTLSKKGLKLIY